MPRSAEDAVKDASLLGMNDALFARPGVWTPQHRLDEGDVGGLADVNWPPAPARPDRWWQVPALQVKADQASFWGALCVAGFVFPGKRHADIIQNRAAVGQPR